MNADSAIIVDGETGKVLYQQNADSLLGIASMSKMMTEYILLDAIKHGKVKWINNILWVSLLIKFHKIETYQMFH